MTDQQRHTAQRIYERLRDEHDFSGGYTIVKDYVRLKRMSQREMFVPLSHPPGQALADFSEAQEIGGVLANAHYFVIDLLARRYGNARRVKWLDLSVKIASWKGRPGLLAP